MADHDGNQEEEVEDFPIPGHSSLQEFSQSVLKKIVTATHHANSLTGLLEDFEYWNSFPSFQRFCNEEGTRIVSDIGELLRHQAVQCGWASGASIDPEDRFERLVDANDIMLENVGSLLDEASGLKKNDKPIVPPTLKQSRPIVSSWNRNKNSGGSTYRLLMAKNIQRPQLKWLEKIDNSNTPFIPYIKHKYHAIKAIEEDFPQQNMETDTVSDFIHDQRVGGDKFSSIRHPYEYELSQFEPNGWQLEEKPPQHYLRIEDTDLTFIDSQSKLDEMLEKLKVAKEIAIDLEHHSYRSFQGFVCLMQLSTRDEDFLVDTLKLRDELYVLNEIFTNPDILKVLHGSDSDIGWLQRDFGLYIINMFDTGQAARTLGEERFSLAHLLRKYCNVSAQKQYQLADWRIRDLPEEMIRYAQEDTHYLLYVYDVLRNQLIARGNEIQNLLRSVYSKSASICLSTYQKPMLFPDSHFKAYQKQRGRLNSHQLECFRLLYGWRDKTAREEDESCGYTLPNHMMFQIAENLPREPQGILACCNPVPPLVKQRVMDIHQLVKQARDFDPVNVQTTVPSDVNNGHPTKRSRKNSEGKEISKFSSGSLDKRSGFEIFKITGPPVETRQPSLSILEEMIKEHLEFREGKTKAKEILAMMRSPFEMYLPNTGKAPVDPSVINQTWVAASKEKVEIVQSKDQESRKMKRKSGDVVAENTTIREMLPKKRKHNRDTTDEDVMEIDAAAPVKLQYDKNVKSSSSYVPFDYSKADLKKFAAGKRTQSAIDQIDITQEPKVAKPIKTKIHSKSGMRSMTSK